MNDILDNEFPEELRNEIDSIVISDFDDIVNRIQSNRATLLENVIKIMETSKLQSPSIKLFPLKFVDKKEVNLPKTLHKAIEVKLNLN